MEGLLHWRSGTTILAAVGAGIGAAVLAFGLFWLWAVKDLPRVPDSVSLWSLNRAPGITFVDEAGEVLAIRGEYYGRAVSYKDLPPYVAQGFIAIEDRRFFEHRGIDRTGMLRAALANFRAGSTVQGGSTITQQLVKNLFLTPERSILRKLQEMILAGRIERRLTKDEILDLYLNRVYLGERAYGVDAAAKRYFGKRAPELTLAEAAMLAGLPKAPSEWAPTRNFAGAKARQQVVLAAMAEAGFITKAQRAEAAAQPITLASKPLPEGELGYAFDMATDEAKRRLGKINDLVIRLTIDPALQDAAVQAVRGRLNQYGRSKRNPLQAGVVLVDGRSAVRALVGGYSYGESKFNRAAQAKRQPGSSFKTFVYAAALQAGLDPETIRYDEPVTVRGWRPENYDRTYKGAVTLRKAFALSLNTVAAEVADEVGLDQVADTACLFGVLSIPCTDKARAKTPIPPSIALGSIEVTLLEMTQSMSVFMRQGQRIDSFLVESMENSRGDVLYQRPPVAPAQVYDPELSTRMNDLLGRVVTSGTGTTARLSNRDAAGKTGTSQDYRDAWFIGFTADYTGGVWMGYDDFHSMPRITGGAGPSLIWHDILSVASQNLPRREIPGVEPPKVSAKEREMWSFYKSLAHAFGKPETAKDGELVQ
jgi:penicillin-binding protein 1A